MQRDTLGGVMAPFINWFRGLSRNIQISLILAVGVFTPAVSIMFTIVFGGISAVFNIIGFAISMLNWKGVLFFVIVGMFFAAKAGYNWITEEDDFDPDDFESESFNRYYEESMGWLDSQDNGSL